MNLRISFKIANQQKVDYGQLYTVATIVAIDSVNSAVQLLQLFEASSCAQSWQGKGEVYGCTIGLFPRTSRYFPVYKSVAHSDLA